MQTQQIDLVNTQLVATQQQLQQLQDRYQELSLNHSILVQELIGVQKTVVNHEHVMQNVMNYLHTVDARQRRDSKVVNPFAQNETSNGQTDNLEEPQQQVSPLDDIPASPLQEATKLLNDLSADVQLNYKNLEHLNELHNRGSGVMSTPPPDSSRNPRGPTSATSSGSIGHDKLFSSGSDGDNTVYPVGQSNGIDPTYRDHFHNIPYPLPTKEADIPNPGTAPVAGRKRSTQIDPGWVRPPQILLVEDDSTCRRIGGKFLYSFHCAIDSAVRSLHEQSLSFSC